VSLAATVAAAGGAAAPASHTARLREALKRSLQHGAKELALARSGYDGAVEVAIAATPAGLLAATPAPAGLRADPQAAGEREWLLVAAALGALVELGALGRLASASDLALRAGAFDGRHLVLALPGTLDAAALDELAALAFEEQVHGVDRLRAHAVGVPAVLLADAEADLRPPIGEGHPLRAAEAVARLGGRPADPESVETLEDAVLALLAPAGSDPARPHADPDPARRVARRILQRLDGMGKWGGYHTDFAHLARGFAGHERALAQEVGEALLAAGLLDSKPSVGQRHVFLNSRRAADIHRLIATGEEPRDLTLPRR